MMFVLLRKGKITQIWRNCSHYHTGILLILNKHVLKRKYISKTRCSISNTTNSRSIQVLNQLSMKQLNKTLKARRLNFMFIIEGNVNIRRAQFLAFCLVLVIGYTQFLKCI